MKQQALLIQAGALALGLLGVLAVVFTDQRAFFLVTVLALVVGGVALLRMRCPACGWRVFRKYHGAKTMQQVLNTTFLPKQCQKCGHEFAD